MIVDELVKIASYLFLIFFTSARDVSEVIHLEDPQLVEIFQSSVVAVLIAIKGL